MKTGWRSNLFSRMWPLCRCRLRMTRAMPGLLGRVGITCEQAKASKRTIVIAEHVVSSEIIRRNPEQTVIPGLLVSHVVEQPFAAHPTAVYGEYDYDAAMIEKYVKASATTGILQGISG